MLRIEEIVGCMDDEFRYALDAFDDARLERLKADTAALRRLRPVGVSHAEAIAMIEAILARRARQAETPKPPPKRRRAPRPKKVTAPPPESVAPPRGPLPLPSPGLAGLLEPPRAALPAIRLPPPAGGSPVIVLPPPPSNSPDPRPRWPLLLVVLAFILMAFALLAA